MLNLIERRLSTITPKEAAVILAERNNYCGQRPLRQSHVDYLAKKMEKGLFHVATVTYAKFPDGSWVLVDGQHSLSGAVQTGIPINASIHGFECQAEEDVFILFSEIDRGMRRSQTDITRAGRQTMSPLLREINAGSVGMFGAAILMAPKENRPPAFRFREITPQNRVIAVSNNPEEALFLNRYHGWLLLNRIAVRMAMVATFRADADRARLFWDGVIRPGNLPSTDPRCRLYTRLLDNDCRRFSAFMIRKVYCACLNHWNAHATGTDIAPEDGIQTPVAMKPTINVPTLVTPTAPSYPATSSNPIKLMTAVFGTKPVPAPVATA